MILNYRHKQPDTPADNPPMLILLHGIGADENDLFGITPFLDPRFLIISARAPFTLPYGGYAWFELTIEPNNIGINVKQFYESREMLLEFIGELINEHNPDRGRIYLCGFSQGAIIGLSAALKEPRKFAGLVAMSGRAMPEMLPDQNDTSELRDFPILVTHGVYDPVLTIDNGRATNEMLSALPVRLKYKEYPMAHEISRESLADVSIWLSSELD